MKISTTRIYPLENDTELAAIYAKMQNHCNNAVENGDGCEDMNEVEIIDE